MGGPGSGRKPKDPSDEIAETVEVVGEVAANLPEKKKPPRKPRPSELKRKMPRPDDFKDHAFAKGINAVADSFAGTKGKNGEPGAAEIAQLGEAWVACMDFYFGGAVTHPLAIAVTATVNFGVLVAMTKLSAPKPRVAKIGPEGTDLSNGIKPDV